MVNEVSKTIQVNETPFGGLFTIQQNNMLVVAQRPDWIRHPVNGSKVYIRNMFVPDHDGKCPNCGKWGRHGLIVTTTNLIIVCCIACKQFVWITPKGNK